MGKVTVVTGGSRSGKSGYAEKLAKDTGEKVLYIATAIPFDDEMQVRIKMHKESRPDYWDTYEGFKDLNEVVLAKGDKYNAILLDCVTVLITNIMFSSEGFHEENINHSKMEEIERTIIAELEKLIDATNQRKTQLILVTNEVGSGVVPESKLGRVFRDLAGRVNQFIAKRADNVYFLVSGIPMKIK